MIIKLEHLAIAAPTPSLYAVNKDKASTLPYIPKDHKYGSTRVAFLDSRPRVAGHMPVQVALAQLQGALPGISLDWADDQQLLELAPVLQVTSEAREHCFPMRGEKTFYPCNTTHS